MFGEGAFEDWAGVDVGFVLGLGSELFDVDAQFFEAFADDFVIVSAEGVASDSAVVFFEGRLFVVVVGGEHDY